MKSRKMKFDHGQEKEGNNRYRIHLTKTFISVTFISFISLAFVLGQAMSLYYFEEDTISRLIALKKFPFQLYKGVLDLSKLSDELSYVKHYVSVNFDSAGSSQMKTNEDYRWTKNGSSSQDNEECTNLQQEDHITVSAEQQQFTTCQHLFLDIRNVEFELLNSIVQVEEKLLEIIHETNLRLLLNPICHERTNFGGISCIGTLLGSHISLYTWPEFRMVTVDIVLFGTDEVISILPVIEDVFNAKSRQDIDNNELPFSKWFIDMRGFRKAKQKSHYMYNDLGLDFLSEGFMYKKKVASVRTKFQMIDIYDKINEEDHPEIKNFEGYDSYRQHHPELFVPNRIVWLDSVEQSSRFGDEAYHESLVHPVMFSHEDPKTVAIIGGGECATLREVLKHRSVKKVKMIEIDEMMVDVSRKYLPSWSNCSDILGSSAWCGDDERVDIFYEDALAWFIDRYAEFTNASKGLHEDLFDVIIMDALDPHDNVPFAEVLYTNVTYLRSIYNALTPDGKIVFQLGLGSSHEDPADDMTKMKRRAELIRILDVVGYEEVHLYSESHCEFGDPWTFLVAEKKRTKHDKSIWYRNTAQLEIDIHKRILRTYSGSPALKHFDGSKMKDYQVPTKPFEVVFCRKSPAPHSCKREKSIMNGVNTSKVMFNHNYGQPMHRDLYDPFLDRQLGKPFIYQGNKLHSISGKNEIDINSYVNREYGSSVKP